MRIACRTGILGILSVFAIASQIAQAQDRDGDRNPGRVTCESSGGRVNCEADTSQGIRMERQLSGDPCVQGRTWGFTERGVWVDRGCRAVFEPAGRAEARSRIEPGTAISVRTDRYISSDRSDGRVYTGSVDRDVVGENGRIAIPRGSPVEMIVRVAPDKDLALDLESVTVNGQRYAIDADTRVESEKRDGIGENRSTAEHVGGGALLGSIIGAIAGGGKGAAIGAGAGAAAGAGTQVLTRGRQVRVPAESILTFQLQRPLVVGVADHGFDRDGDHFHDNFH
jgi:hypothetical protein